MNGRRTAGCATAALLLIASATGCKAAPSRASASGYGPMVTALALLRVVMA